jgi:hypothetical protein
MVAVTLGKSLYMGNGEVDASRWYRMCSCQPPVGLVVLEINKKLFQQIANLSGLATAQVVDPFPFCE